MIKTKDTYKVFAAPLELTNTSEVGLRLNQIQGRTIVKITNSSTGLKTYCEALQIDANFRNKYNQPGRYPIEERTNAIVISKWYRDKLGIKNTQDSVDLIISSKNSFYWDFLLTINHPQVIVRQSAWLGLIGIVLGLVGLK